MDNLNNTLNESLQVEAITRVEELVTTYTDEFNAMDVLVNGTAIVMVRSSKTKYLNTFYIISSSYYH